MNAEPSANAATDVLATLCRMSLVEEESMAVNGAYKRAPPASAAINDS